MTREEIEKLAIELDSGAFCHCREKGRAMCKRHVAAAQFAHNLVLRAYEEAAQIAESPDTEYREVWEACDVPDSMREGIAAAIRALKDETQDASKVSA